MRIQLLSAFLFDENESLEEFLANKVFKNAKKTTMYPEKNIVEGFNKYINDYKKLLTVEQKATEVL